MPRLKEDKRQKILSVATELFRHAHDMRKVSVEDVAQQAGVSPTTIYNYFGTRESLVAEVAKRLIAAITRQVGGILRSDLPFDKKLVAAIAGKVDAAAQINNEIITKMVSQNRYVAPFIEEIYRTEIRPLWLEFMAEGKRQGYIDPRLDDDALLTYLEIIRAGFAARPEVIKDYREHMDFIEKLTNFAFFGFLKKDIELFQKEKIRNPNIETQNKHELPKS